MRIQSGLGMGRPTFWTPSLGTWERVNLGGSWVQKVPPKGQKDVHVKTVDCLSALVPKSVKSKTRRRMRYARGAAFARPRLADPYKDFA